MHPPPPGHLSRDSKKKGKGGGGGGGGGGGMIARAIIIGLQGNCIAWLIECYNCHRRAHGGGIYALSPEISASQLDPLHRDYDGTMRFLYALHIRHHRVLQRKQGLSQPPEIRAKLAVLCHDQGGDDPMNVLEDITVDEMLGHLEEALEGIRA